MVVKTVNKVRMKRNASVPPLISPALMDLASTETTLAMGRLIASKVAKNACVYLYPGFIQLFIHDVLSIFLL